jgi:hypothetical protein
VGAQLTHARVRDIAQHFDAIEIGMVELIGEMCQSNTVGISVVRNGA